MISLWAEMIVGHKHTYPFNMIDPESGRILLQQGEDPCAASMPWISYALCEGRVLCLDFSPDRCKELGVYPEDLSDDMLSEMPAKALPTGKAFSGEYKTAAFRDVIDGVTDGAVVLDLGCHHCALLRKFPEHALRIGVDISHRSLFGITPNALDSGVSHLWVCDAAKLPVPEGIADVVLCCDILEHLMEPERLLKEAFRVLKPGGTLVVTVPNLVHIGNRLSFLFGSGAGVEFAQLLKGRSPIVTYNSPRFPDQTIHLRWFTSSSLMRFLTEHGFQVKRRFGCGPLVTRLRLGRFAYTTALLTGVVAHKP